MSGHEKWATAQTGALTGSVRGECEKRRRGSMLNVTEISWQAEEREEAVQPQSQVSHGNRAVSSSQCAFY